MSSPTLQRPARLSLVPGICIALALAAGAYATPDDTDKKANDTSVTVQATDTGTASSGVNPSPGQVIGSRLFSPRVNGLGGLLLGGQCENACGVGDVPEGEDCAGDFYVDDTNGGCNSDPDIFGEAFCDVTICGTSSNFDTTGDGQSNSRDTDWYLISANELAAADTDQNGVVQFQATLTSEFDGVVFYIAFNPDCASLTFPGSAGFSGADCAGGEPAVATLIVDEHPAGVVVFVSTGLSDGTPIFAGFECAGGLNDYTLLITCDEPPIDCAAGSGPCGEPNGSPGCEDPECCKDVCAIDPLCCIEPWSQNCANIAIFDVQCAGLPCPVSSCDGGVCTLTQSQNSFLDSGNQIACAYGDGTTTDNYWARCYNLVAEGVPAGENLTINSVTFGVAQATADGINVAVNLYIDCNGCPPEGPVLDVILLATQSLVVNIADVGSMITVNFPAGTVVPAGTDLIVEVGNVDDGFEQFAFRAMSNDVGQCGPTYLRSPCSEGWDDLADIGFPDSHLIQSISATVGGVVAVECPDIPQECGKGAGPCNVPNGTPGCEDTFCCAQVCAQDPFCCIGDWDQQCANIAIFDVLCAEEPCFPPKGLEGVAVPSSENFDSYTNGMLLVGVNGWGSWDDNPTVRGTVSDVQSRSAPHSVLIDNTPDDDVVQQYTGAYCEGQWTYTIWQYVPSNMVGTSYFILLNTYEDNGPPKNWSTQVQFTATTGIVEWDFAGEQLPLITDEWVEIRVEIDLDADSQEFFYGGNQLGTRLWTDNDFLGGPGVLNIRAVDLYSNTSTAVYYDDVSLVSADGKPCPADFDNSGAVDVKDLLFLLGAWGPCPPKGECLADFDLSGAVDVKDLLFLLGAWGPCP